MNSYGAYLLWSWVERMKIIPLKIYLTLSSLSTESLIWNHFLQNYVKFLVGDLHLATRLWVVAKPKFVVHTMLFQQCFNFLLNQVGTILTN